jgi:hypothetical protein
VNSVTIEGVVVRYGKAPDGFPNLEFAAEAISGPGLRPTVNPYPVPKELIQQATENLYGRRVRLTLTLEVLP